MNHCHPLSQIKIISTFLIWILIAVSLNISASQTGYFPQIFKDNKLSKDKQNYCLKTASKLGRDIQRYNEDYYRMDCYAYCCEGCSTYPSYPRGSDWYISHIKDPGWFDSDLKIWIENKSEKQPGQNLAYVYKAFCKFTENGWFSFHSRGIYGNGSDLWYRFYQH